MSEFPADKTEAVREQLRRQGSALFAFSGGQDSALLADIAREVLGDRAVAATVRSAFLPGDEYRHAVDLARDIGIEHAIVDVDVLQGPKIVDNPPDRCYHCKRHLLERLLKLAEQRGLTRLCDGANADDAADVRPGMRAAAELGVLSPLADAGIVKADIRALSRRRGLSTWDRPPSACLASRIPHDTRIDAETLARVERAEAALHGLGFRQCRVRAHGAIARVELPPADLAAAVLSREAVIRPLKDAGFRFVALDLEGFRSGSLNET